MIVINDSYPELIFKLTPFSIKDPIDQIWLVRSKIPSILD